MDSLDVINSQIYISKIDIRNTTIDMQSFHNRRLLCVHIYICRLPHCRPKSKMQCESGRCREHAVGSTPCSQYVYTAKLHCSSLGDVGTAARF